jgi:hypothetical protein
MGIARAELLGAQRKAYSVVGGVEVAVSIRCKHRSNVVWNGRFEKYTANRITNLIRWCSMRQEGLPHPTKQGKVSSNVEICAALSTRNHVMTNECMLPLAVIIATRNGLGGLI